MSQRIGYVMRYRMEKTGTGEDEPDIVEVFRFKEAPFTRTINSRGDRIRSDILCGAWEYEEIVSNAKMMKENPKMILVCEPFLLDDELRERCMRWVERANKADRKEYDPFA